MTAGDRLDDALRGFLAEQGTKRAGKEDLWSLVTATERLRLTTHILAGLRGMPGADGTLAPGPCPHLLWVQDRLHHLSISAQTIAEPAPHVAEARRHPW